MAYLGVPQSKLENLTTNVQIVNLSASFDGTTTTFNLQDSRGDAVYAVHERALLVILGGITQKPGVDYTTTGTTITFTTAPVSNLTIHIRKLYGVQRIIGVNDGVISPVKLSTGGPVWNSSGNVTISGDLNVTGAFNAGGNGLFWEDSERANFGDDNDLHIYHDGNSYLNSTSGNLYIKSENDTDIYVRAADDLFLQAGGTSPGVKVIGGGATELYHVALGEKKLETTADGVLLTSNDAGSSAGPEIDLFRNSASPADADYLGQIKFTGKQDGGGTVNYAKITGKILDASNGTEDGILEFMLRKAGSNNIAARFRSDSLQLLNGTKLTVNGDVTFDSTLSVGTNATGHTLTLYGSSSSSFRISKSGVLAYDHTFDGSTYTIANNNNNAGIPIVIGTRTSGGESLRITAAGNVEVHNNSSTTSSRVSAHGFIARENWGTHTSIDNGMFSPATNTLAFATDSGERLRITGDGRVLVDATTVQAHANMDDLQVGNGSGNRGITVSSGTSNFGTVAFGDSADGSGTDRYAGFVEYYHNDNSMRLGTVSQERVRITSDGSIGVGAYTPVTDVDISQKTGAVALPQGTTAQRPSGSAPYIRKNTTNNALEFYNGTEWVEIITDYFPTGSTILG